MVNELVCKFVYPGIGCGLYEMLVLGIMYLLTSFYCIYFSIHLIFNKFRKTKNISSIQLSFWISMSLWMIYNGIVTIVPFDYNESTIRFWHGGVCDVLHLIPVAMFILLICELLFTYINPENRTKEFFRLVFVVFTVAFIIVGIALSICDDESDDPRNNLTFWHGCTEFIFTIFIVFPALKLINAISHPVVQPEDVSCIRYTTIGVIALGSIFFLKCIYNVTLYFRVNPIGKWFERESRRVGVSYTAKLRVYLFSYNFIMYYLTSIMIIFGTKILYKHELKFDDDPFYSKVQNEYQPVFENQ